MFRTTTKLMSMSISACLVLLAVGGGTSDAVSAPSALRATPKAVNGSVGATGDGLRCGSMRSPLVRDILSSRSLRA